MSWDVRSVYYYLVCFATLLMIVFGAVQMIQHALNLAIPREAYGPSALDVYERYRMRLAPAFGPNDGVESTLADTLDRATIERMATEERVRMARMQRRDDVRGLLRSLALLLIAGPVYFYHWRRVRRSPGD